MPLPDDDQERFESLKNAMAETYATGTPRPVRRRRPFPKKIFWLSVAGCALVVFALAAATIAQWRAARSFQNETQSQPPRAVAIATAPVVTIPPNYTPPPHTAPPRTPPPHTPKPPTPPPSTPQPTQQPTKEPTQPPSPQATASAAPSPSAPVTGIIHNAFLLVKTNGQLKVGAQGSCGGLDRTVEVRGYPKGCTVFDADSTGPLANGRGVVLVVPVSTTEDVGDVKYGLLYVRTSDADEPHYVGLIRSRGSGRVVVRLEGGRIMEQTGGRVSYYTFNGRRIVRAPE